MRVLHDPKADHLDLILDEPSKKGKTQWLDLLPRVKAQITPAGPPPKGFSIADPDLYAAQNMTIWRVRIEQISRSASGDVSAVADAITQLANLRTELWQLTQTIDPDSALAAKVREAIRTPEQADLDDMASQMPGQSTTFVTFPVPGTHPGPRLVED